MQIKYKCNGEFQPVVATAGAAGIDLYNNGEDVIIPFGDSAIVNTGVAFEIPTGHVGLLFIRGGHGNKGYQLSNCVGVVDADYRGEVVASMVANKTRYSIENDLEYLTVKRGERFCQMVIVPHGQYELLKSEELSETARGAGKHNSTGVN